MGRKPLTEEQRAAMRKRILDAARDAVEEGGFRGISMRGVANRVGVSAMTIYLYYDNRRAVIRALIREGIDIFRQKLGAVEGNADDPRAELIALGRAYVQFSRDYPAYYRALLEGSIDGVGFSAEEEAQLSGAVMGALAPVIQCVSRIVKDPTEAMNRAVTLWCTLHGFAGMTDGDRFRYLNLPAATVQEGLEDILIRAVES